jgi:hypothetical protein
MELKSLKQLGSSVSEKERKRYFRFENLLNEIKSRDLKVSTIEAINQQIDKVNESLNSEKSKKDLKMANYRTFKILEKEEKLVAKTHYQNMWMVLGMTVFGLPMGMTFAISLDNYGLFAIGMPIGMAIGIAVGAGMDKKAKEEGKQLNLEMDV